jgi:hypothetical protein
VKEYADDTPMRRSEALHLFDPRLIGLDKHDFEVEL